PSCPGSTTTVPSNLFRRLTPKTCPPVTGGRCAPPRAPGSAVSTTPSRPPEPADHATRSFVRQRAGAGDLRPETGRPATPRARPLRGYGQQAHGAPEETRWRPTTRPWTRSLGTWTAPT